MHLEYQPANRMMVDFAGKKLFYTDTDTDTGECIECQVFVGILPFSGLIFYLAVLSQRTEDFTRCINEMLKYFKGV